MKRRRKILVVCAGPLLLLPCLVTALQAQETAARRILWQKAPIAIHLTVGEERLVHFSEPVSVGVPTALDARLRTQTVNGTVYWRAATPFSATRVAVRELNTGGMYLFDLEASLADTDNTPVRVMVDTVRPNVSSAGPTPAAAQYDYVGLTRFAALQLYAPRRLISLLPDVVRVPLKDDAVPLVPGGAVEARPLFAWRAGSHYLTAVKLVNRAREPQILDPRMLRGKWLAATFQHARLLPAGDEADTTVVYLVSGQPFEASSLP